MSKRVAETDSSKTEHSLLYKESITVLQQLFNNIYAKGKTVPPPFSNVFPSERYAAFVVNSKDFYDRWQETKEIGEVLRILKGSFGGRERKLESMTKLLAYLGLVESLGVTLVDMVLLMFIANGTDIHTRRPYIRHIEKLDELKDIDLSDKQKFLKHRGLKKFSRFINRKDRNAIAHLKFKINKEGEIVKTDSQPINIDQDIARFWEGIEIMKQVFDDIGFWKWLTRETSRGTTSAVAAKSI
jgi:hypothetical protein